MKFHLNVFYTFLQKKNWEEALKTGKYVGDTLSTQGFIHFSLPSQLIEVANYLYKGRRGLVLLYVDESQVMDEIRYERPEGEEEAYPHLYMVHYL